MVHIQEVIKTAKKKLKGDGYREMERDSKRLDDTQNKFKIRSHKPCEIDCSNNFLRFLKSTEFH